MTKSENTNEYLALRQKNIARNEAKLRDLGLLTPKTSTPAQRIRPNSNKSKIAVTKVTPVAVRRSTRGMGRPTTYEDLPTISIGGRRTRKSNPIHDYTTTTTYIVDSSSPGPKKKPKASSSSAKTTVSLSENSARSISLDIQRLVAGFLGKPMTRTGKAAVMEEMARLYSERPLDTSIYTKISFNKYCGVQEWKRGVFLWVNLGGKSNDYVNDFLDGGRKMSWFGGSRMHSESKPIQKLLKVGSAAAHEGQLDASDGIVLWCRRFEVEKRTFGPYYCLGRLAYFSHDPGSIPISFVWTLLDHDSLVAENNDVILQMMQKK